MDAHPSFTRSLSQSRSPAQQQGRQQHIRSTSDSDELGCAAGLPRTMSSLSNLDSAVAVVRPAGGGKGQREGQHAEGLGTMRSMRKMLVSFMRRTL
jgi:hypothetical protein